MPPIVGPNRKWPLPCPVIQPMSIHNLQSLDGFLHGSIPFLFDEWESAVEILVESPWSFREVNPVSLVVRVWKQDPSAETKVIDQYTCQ